MCSFVFFAAHATLLIQESHPVIFISIDQLYLVR